MNRQPETKALDSSAGEFTLEHSEGLLQNDTHLHRPLTLSQSKGQRGVAMVMMLIVLAVGSILLVPTLSYTTTALNAYRISREAAWVQYALDAATQQALWEMQYDTKFQDCDTEPATIESFVDCVALKGQWTLTTQALPLGTPYTLVPKVNGQDVSVTVEVPGGLTAPLAPTATPSAQRRLCAQVTRDTDPSQPGDQTWVQIGDPITYTITISACTSSPSNFNLRRIKALLSPSFTYVASSTSTSYVPAPSDLLPEVIACDVAATPPLLDYYPCPQSLPPITDSTVMVNWPDGLSNYAGGSAISFVGGQTTTWTFQATPSTWGVFYVDVVLCYFSSNSGDPGPCSGDPSDTHRTGKVAPVVVGMFNIKGNGKGYAFGASSKMDSGGSGLVSIEN